MSDALLERLNTLKRERNAVILGHNYQRPEVQDASDFTGDSLGLSRRAASTDADVILFCGVHFMAETAAIICPEKSVLIPDPHAGCPMANMITARELADAKAEHPGAAVVCYVNSTAEIKAMSDVCCTSANAVDVVRSIPADRAVLFVPDQSLGSWVARQLGRELILWPGYCPTHHRMLPEHVRAAKEEHPAAEVVVHPECLAEVTEMADHVASTSGMLRYCKESRAKEFIVGTETGMLHPLRKENPEKRFYPVTPLADCPNMKLGTLQKMAWALEDMVYPVEVPPDVAERARGSIERMLTTG
ncbi:MAG: quinolinate synthase NadA [Planctomycetota bacterium]